VPALPHDGFRIMARRDGAGVRLITRHGNDLTRRCLKMQTLLVDLILAAAVGAVFLIARRPKTPIAVLYWDYAQRLSGKARGISGEKAMGKFFALFWGWADYNPKDWSSAPYKRGYAS
jgi:hypothetical protein